jgi:hypothetical protein
MVMLSPMVRMFGPDVDSLPGLSRPILAHEFRDRGTARVRKSRSTLPREKAENPCSPFARL